MAMALACHRSTHLNFGAGKKQAQRKMTRPARRMPNAVQVASYWSERGEPFDVDLGHPACFGCQFSVDKWNHLERAHLINRGYGGLDHAANLAMLCRRCHRYMPNFDTDQIEQALDYARHSAWHIFQWITEELAA